MRTWLNVIAAVGLAIVAGLPSSAAAQEVDGLEVVRRIANAGAVDLAFHRIAQSQPAEPNAPGWIEWELLRIDLLGRRGRDDEVLKRVALARNVAMPARSAAQLWLSAARAAQRLGQPAQARASYLSYFLRAEPGASEYRDARLAVINSYLSEGNADAAYRSMLRLQQDFGPLRAAEAERFVAALIVADRAAEAATWLPQLDKAAPAAVMLRLRAGLVSPEIAIAQARAMLAKGAGEPALALLSQAALRQKNRALEIEADENRLNLGGTEERGEAEKRAAALWNLYSQVGQHTANQAQLLIGDDAGWIDRAVREGVAQPQLARSLLGHVVSAARSEGARTRAQLQLVTSLRDSKLALTALRLFSDQARFPTAGLDARVRFELGALAASSKRPALAVRYWQNLARPAELSPQDWGLRYLTVLFQADMADAGLEAARSLIAARPALQPQSVTRLVAIASETLDSWRAKPAESLFSMLLPIVVGAERVTVLLGLGKAREMGGEFRLAAEAFLHAAALSAAPAADREALRARELGALNLAKAGLLDDARASYEWLSANAADPALRERATRALSAFSPNFAH